MAFAAVVSGASRRHSPSRGGEAQAQGRDHEFCRALPQHLVRTRHFKITGQLKGTNNFSYAVRLRARLTTSHLIKRGLSLSGSGRPQITEILGPRIGAVPGPEEIQKKTTLHTPRSKNTHIFIFKLYTASTCKAQHRQRRQPK